MKNLLSIKLLQTFSIISFIIGFKGAHYSYAYETTTSCGQSNSGDCSVSPSPYDDSGRFYDVTSRDLNTRVVQQDLLLYDYSMGHQNDSDPELPSHCKGLSSVFQKALCKVLKLDKFEKTNEKIEAKVISDYAPMIEKISLCYGVDPSLFASLVYSETTLGVETDNGGLTQMTNIGIKEVLDQLGLSGDANQQVVLYFSSKFESTECGYKNAQNFISRFRGVRSSDELKKTIERLKSSLTNNHELSLHLGAMLFKTYLAKSAYSSSNILSKREISVIYHNALKNYRGSGNNGTNVAYADKVLRNAKKILEAASSSLNIGATKYGKVGIKM